jgi:hypothetical protein
LSTEVRQLLRENLLGRNHQEQPQTTVTRRRRATWTVTQTPTVTSISSTPPTATTHGPQAPETAAPDVVPTTHGIGGFETAAGGLLNHRETVVSTRSTDRQRELDRRTGRRPHRGRPATVHTDVSVTVS